MANSLSSYFFSKPDSKHAATAPVGTLVKETSKQDAPKSNPSRKGEETLRKFFADNPGEALTIDDAADKLGITRKSAGTYLARLKGLGVLKRTSLYELNDQEGT